MHYADYKTILFPGNGMNIYRGCMQGCIYCDSRSACDQHDAKYKTGGEQGDVVAVDDPKEILMRFTPYPLRHLIMTRYDTDIQNMMRGI